MEKLKTDIAYEIEILTANIDLYENLRQQFIEEEKTLPTEGRTPVGYLSDKYADPIVKLSSLLQESADLFPKIFQFQFPGEVLSTDNWPKLYKRWIKAGGLILDCEEDHYIR